jgi:hypothetical protein
MIFTLQDRDPETWWLVSVWFQRPEDRKASGVNSSRSQEKTIEPAQAGRQREGNSPFFHLSVLSRLSTD